MRQWESVLLQLLFLRLLLRELCPNIYSYNWIPSSRISFKNSLLLNLWASGKKIYNETRMC